MRIILSKVLAIALLVTLIPLSAQEQPLPTTKQVSAALQKQVMCLAKNIYYESATESYEGKLAVANVVMNRVNSPQYPKTVCEVVYQKIKNTYQFSWVGQNVGTINNKYAWEECMIIARKALTEHKLHDIIYKTNAMYYHNTSVNPGWKLKKVTRIGNHIFYSAL